MNAQNAEYLFNEKFSKLSFRVGVDQLYSENTPDTLLSYEWPNFSAFSGGLFYRFAPKSNFVFKTGLNIVLYNFKDSYAIPSHNENQFSYFSPVKSSIET